MNTLPIIGRYLAATTLTAGLLLTAGPAVAQDDDPGSTGPQPGGSPTSVPIDGGTALLLTSGVAYGLRKLQKRRAH